VAYTVRRFRVVPLEHGTLLGVNPYYQELAGDAPGRQQRWREFLLGEDLRKEMVRRGEWTVGDAAFRQRQATVQGRPALRRRGHPRKQLPTV
jgi:ribosomal protein L34